LQLILPPHRSANPQVLTIPLAIAPSCLRPAAVYTKFSVAERREQANALNPLLVVPIERAPR
jgi:hypothetical protein